MIETGPKEKKGKPRLLGKYYLTADAINFYELAKEDPRCKSLRKLRKKDNGWLLSVPIERRLRDASLFDKETREGEREKRRKLLLIYHDGSLGLELLVVISAEVSSRPPNEFRLPSLHPSALLPHSPRMGERLILYTKAPSR